MFVLYFSLVDYVVYGRCIYVTGLGAIVKVMAVIQLPGAVPDDPP